MRNIEIGIITQLHVKRDFIDSPSIVSSLFAYIHLRGTLGKLY